MRNTALTGLFVVCLGLARSSAAQPADESTRTAVRALAAEGDGLLNQGDYAGALERFVRASALIPLPTLRLREAVCLEKLGRWVEAADRYRQVSRTELEPGASPEFGEAVRQAESNAAALEARLPKVVLALSGDELAGARVEVDGREVPEAAWGAGWPVNPGRHTVTASKGSRKVAREFEASESASVSVQLTLPSPQAVGAPPLPAQSAHAPSPVPRTGPALRRSSSQPTWGWVGIGIGAAGLAAGAIAGGLAASKHGALPATCQNDRCPSSAQEDVDSYNAMRTYSTVGFAVGAVGIGAGLLLLLTAPDENEKKPQARVQPWVGLGTTGVAGRF